MYIVSEMFIRTKNHKMGLFGFMQVCNSSQNVERSKGHNWTSSYWMMKAFKIGQLRQTVDRQTGRV